METQQLEDRQSAGKRPVLVTSLPSEKAAPSAALARGPVWNPVENGNEVEVAKHAGEGPFTSQPSDASYDRSKAGNTPYFQPYWSPAFFGTAIGAILIIWAFCWMYIGAFWNPTTRLQNLHVAVLDCDMVPPASSLNTSFAPLLSALIPTPLATGLLSGAVWKPSSPLGHALHWENGSCGGAQGPAGLRCGTPQQEAACVAALSEDVRQGGPWALLYFPSNFTASYLSWYPGSGVTPQNRQPMGRYFYARGRDYSTYSYLAAIILSTMVPGLSHSLTASLVANPQVMALMSPSFLATGIAVQEVDLAPVKNFGQHFASYIFCVLLWLGSSFVVVGSYQFKLPAEAALLGGGGGGSAGQDSNSGAGEGGGSSRPMVRFGQVAWALMVKALMAAVFMFALVVLLCVVLWALGGGNEQWYYNPGYALAFGWYMSWSFISINAVLLHVIGIERFSSVTALLLILQLTSASAILSTELSNRFFYIGKGLPFYYGVRGFRTIFFGTLENKMYINWLVFTAYNVVFAPLGLLLVVHRVWTTPARVRKQHHRGGDAAGVGGIVLPVAGGFA